MLPGDDVAWPPTPQSSASPSPPAPSEQPTAPPEPTVAPPAVDTPLLRSARLLAGQAVEPESSVALTAVRAHARKLAPVMTEYEQQSGTPMQAWAARELSPSAGQTVFYPFSGPDFLTVHRLFPKASRFVLVALQEGGLPPVIERMPERTAVATLRVHGNAMVSFAQKGFFVTAKLGRGYSVPGAWTGITGMLMAFAVLEGYDVLEAAPLRVTDDQPDVVALVAPDSHAADWSSVRLVLRDRDARIVLLDYLDLDLSNSGLPSGSAARRIVERSATEHVLIKAASHLLQYPGFTALRDIILNETKELVQDETGVRYAELEDPFTVTLYGKFVGVNRLFDPRPQHALKIAYQERTDIRPLDFPFGYHKPAGSCLIVGRRK